jgi:glycosyltransferase involved in cell wall biosynthesis
MLAKILQRRYEVEIAGPFFGDDIWKPVAGDKSINFEAVKMCRGLKPYWQTLDLIKKIDGDVIYASKPLFTSFGVGLIKKASKKRPLILDIDDWQMGFIKERHNNFSAFSYLKSLVSSALLFYKQDSFWNNLICEKLIPFAAETVVSNTFLKEKFGGTIVWHGRDTKAFDPKKFNKIQIKDKYKLREKKKVVMFLGTLRPYKGLEDLIKAVHMLKNRNVILAIVGIDFNSQYPINLVKFAKKMLDNNFIGFGFQPYQSIPEFLAMADIVVIPQKRNFATIGQMPAKVFDAMAMAKPIIATTVSDLPKIIDGCGWIVEPGSPEKLSESIQYVLYNPREAEEMGLKAREKCIENYSLDAIEEVLVEIFRKYE